MYISAIILICLLLTHPTLNAQTLKFSCNSNSNSINCFICNCYHESRGELFSGKVAVARTILARMESPSFPATACGVIYQASQFSWTFDNIDNNISIPANKPADRAAFYECKTAVDTANNLGSNGVAYFYNPKKASPAWAKEMKVCGTVGNHRFVTPRNSKCPSSLGATSSNSTNNYLRGEVGGEASGTIKPKRKKIGGSIR